MTRQEAKSTAAKAIPFVMPGIAVIGIIGYLLNTAYVPRGAYANDQQAQQTINDTLFARTQQNGIKILEGRALQLRILCYMQANNHERPVSECVQ